MPKIKVLSGHDIVKIFSAFDFDIESQKGSHVKLRRILDNGDKQTLTIPLHDELDKGTTRAIFRQGLKYISENTLKPFFYNE